MKKFGIIVNCGINLFIITFHFSLGKVAMNALHLCKSIKDCLTGIGHGAKGINKTPSSFSNCQRQNKDHCALANCGRVEFLKLRYGHLRL
jgi:hypothetical protein